MNKDEMSRISAIPRAAAAEANAARSEIREAGAESIWNWNALSWLVPKVPLRQVICLLGAGQDPVAEQFRLLHARLQQLRQTCSLRTILVTSSLPGEGSSFVALNLATALSQRGRNKVLLLEADLRRPSYCNAMGLSPVSGLANYCDSTESLPSFVYRISGVDLCLLPAGGSNLQPTAILSSQRMAQALQEAGNAFDWVVVDSAPLLPVADSVVLSMLCDGILLVVRHRIALKTALREALQRIETAKLLGVILNHFPVQGSCPAYFQNAAAIGCEETSPVAENTQAA